MTDVYAYITNIFDNNVLVIDTSTKTVVATVTVGSSPSGSCVTPNGAYAYVPNGSPSLNVSVIDTATNTVVATVTISYVPFSIAAAPDGASVYVTQGYPSSDSISVID